MSQITNRKGLVENLPQLAGAELGWAIDTRQLYIGNGTIADGAPVVGNTEILTEFSDILSLGSTYTYKGTEAGYVVATGPGGSAIVRSLQDKFDDMASVRDFGATGDGTTDDTAAINRALYELFCRETNTQVRRSLFFPAGTYIVSDTILVPPHAKLYGEGITSSIIQFQASVIAATSITIGTRYIIDTLGTTDFTTVGASVNAVGTVFTATAIPIGTGTVKYFPYYVIESADSLQQTGTNIGNNGASAPTGIEIDSIGVYSTEDQTLIRLDSITNSSFNLIGLHGPKVTAATAKVIGNGSSAIEIASTNVTSHDITFSKLDTQGTTYALYIDDYVKGVVFEESGCNYHYKGCSIGVNPINGGPTGVVISRNIFDNITLQGIHFGNVTFNSSGFNVFYNVANNFSVTPVSPVIQMDSAECVSIGDLFERTDADDQIQPRVGLLGNGGIAIDGASSIHIGAYERQVGLHATLADNTVSGSVFTFSDSSPITFRVDYSITRSTNTRMGSLMVTNNGNLVDYNDEYTQSADLGVTLDVIGSGTNSELIYTTTSTGLAASLSFSVARLN